MNLTGDYSPRKIRLGQGRTSEVSAGVLLCTSRKTEPPTPASRAGTREDKALDEFNRRLFFLGAHVEIHRHDDDDALEDFLIMLADTDEAHAVIKHAHDENAEESS